jgi:glutathione synthase/RimK-type ligase-like ATP-grasp enzyme
MTDQKLGTAELLYKCAQQMGMQPSWLTPKGVFAVTVEGERQYINFTCSQLNSHVGASLARSKYLTRLILEHNGLENIPFARPQTHAQAQDFLDTFGTIIAKPVRGWGAQDIHLITKPEQLEALCITNYILEQYIAGKEMRYLVLNGLVIGVHESEYGTSVAANRPLKRTSYPQDMWDPLLIALSTRIAHIVGLNFAAVDFMVDASGHAYVLEVNTAPGLKWFHAPTSGPVVDVARLFLEAMFPAKDPSVSLEDDTLLGTVGISGVYLKEATGEL